MRDEPVDLAEVAREAVARHEAAARAFGVELRAEAEESWVDGDPDRLLQVASNLIENALRETPTGGSVVVSARAATLAVADTGPGIPRPTWPTRSSASTSTTRPARTGRSAAGSGWRSSSSS